MRYAASEPSAVVPGVRRPVWLFQVGVAASLLAACGAAPEERGASAERNIAHVLGGAETSGFARAVVPRTFVFPRDHGPHPEYKHEWWYVTGNLEAEGKRHFGFQLTFFRIALAPGTRTGDSAWGTSQLYMAHFALADVAGERFYSSERFSRASAGLAGASPDRLRVWLDNWSMEAVSAEDSGGEGIRFKLRAGTDGAAVDLQAEAAKPVVLQGERGLSRKSEAAGNASYYYSVTRLRTTGAVTLKGKRWPVRGLSWLDREWSTSALDRTQVGWDWFALQLEDGRDLMFYRLRRGDGTVDPLSRGTLVGADGSVRTLTPGDIELEVSGYWQSPHTQARYPNAWRLALPGEKLNLKLTPYLADQELRLAVRYWEGAVRVAGTSDGQTVQGSGYVELTGYRRPGGQAHSSR